MVPPPHGATMNWSVSCFRSYCQWKVAVSEDVQCRPKSVVDWFAEFDSVLSLFVWLAWYWWSHIWRGRGRRYGRGKITLLLRSIFLIYLVLLSQIISFFFQFVVTTFKHLCISFMWFMWCQKQYFHLYTLFSLFQNKSTHDETQCSHRVFTIFTIIVTEIFWIEWAVWWIWISWWIYRTLRTWTTMKWKRRSLQTERSPTMMALRRRTWLFWKRSGRTRDKTTWM